MGELEMKQYWVLILQLHWVSVRNDYTDFNNAKATK